MQNLKVILRKIKARISGNYPCTYETTSGHDFVLNGKIPEKINSFTEVDYKCKHCGLDVYYSLWVGGFVKKGNL